MRIISGKYRGRKINAPKNLPVRPTTNFAKESLFNILTTQYSVEDKVILDCFAGSGNMSFEFLSRGAKDVYGVDMSAKCIKHLIQTSKEWETENFKAIKRDAVKFVKNAKIKFDIIFADPPYNWPHYHEFINTVFEKDLLTQKGLLIIEHDKTHQFKTVPNFVEERTYGHVHFSIFEL
jgi:16S rRNA (guanine(966)-N(2))-methyltransferase RsmD